LVEIGNLPEEVLEHKDSFPLPEQEIRKAIEWLGYATNPDEAGPALAIVLSHREQALPLLRRAWETGPQRTKLAYAKVLGFLGVREVVPATCGSARRDKRMGCPYFAGQDGRICTPAYSH
jgi:hypothetical protein